VHTASVPSATQVSSYAYATYGGSQTASECKAFLWPDEMEEL